MMYFNVLDFIWGMLGLVVKIVWLKWRDIFIVLVLKYRNKRVYIRMNE